MAVAFDNSGSATGNTVTTLTADITAATVGAACFMWIYNANTETSITNTGWTQIVSLDESTTSHYSLWWRTKQSGDTTFAPSWPTAQGSSLVWVSYTGAATTPYEAEADVAISTATTTETTPSSTPTSTGRWATCFYAARSTTATFNYTSADAAQTLRVQNVNTANRWAAVMASDSNATVAVTAQSYTATLSTSESHGAAAILFVVPGATTPVADAPYTVLQAVNRAATY